MNKILLTILIFFTFIKIQPAQSLSQQVPEFQSTDIKCAICIEDMLPVNAITRTLTDIK